MKKYKLIKNFPGSDELGTIITGSKETMYSKGLGYRNYDWAHVEIHPEFWEEVVEKDYEIISQSIGVKKCDPKDGYKVVRSTSPVIFSVKRLSDGEIFSVGDEFTGYSPQGNTIKRFGVSGSILSIHTTNQGTITNTPSTGLFKSIKKVVEKDYEIISFTQDSGITDLWVEFENGWCRSYNGKPITNPYTTEEILSNKLYRIASVKRLSDGEIFSVGDKFTGCTLTEHTIQRFELCGDILLIHTNKGVTSNISLFKSVKKVVEKDYEIISYWSPRIGDTKYLYYEGHEDWDNINESKYHPIHSVKRLSDGEVFTIGDKIKVSQYGSDKIISKFSLTNDNSSFWNGVWIHYTSGDGCSHIRNAIKIKTKVDMNNAELEFMFFMNGTSGSFKTNLFNTIMSADNTNQKKLSLGFPDEVEVVRRYQQEDGYWQELLEK